MAAPIGHPGRGQIRVLEERVQARRRNFDYYHETLGHLPGIDFREPSGREAPWGRHTRWLTCLTINPDEFGATREDLRLALEAENIEARPVWKPMHCGGPLGAIFAAPRGLPEAVGGQVAEALFADGLCLPSGSNLTDAELARVVGVVQRVWQNAQR